MLRRLLLAFSATPLMPLDAISSVSARPERDRAEALAQSNPFDPYAGNDAWLPPCEPTEEELRTDEEPSS